MDPFLVWFLAPISGIIGFLFLAWCFDTQDNRDDAGHEAVVGSLLIAILFVLGSFGYSWANQGWPMVAMHLALASAIGLPILAVWCMRKFEIEDRFRRKINGIWSWTKFKFANWLKRWRERPEAIIDEAQKRVLELCAIISASPWVETRESIERIAREHLPNLG